MTWIDWALSIAWFIGLIVVDLAYGHGALPYYFLGGTVVMIIALYFIEKIPAVPEIN